ncbi:MAG: ATP-sensitive inward rectifier potassium channel 10 [Spirochaetes bacterium]|nr:ATP-sensitive inward rectifier potassium channel 10 [Spirochaetota bacterium]
MKRTKTARHKEVMTSASGVRVVSHQGSKDFYFYLLNASWPRFFMTLFVIYIAINASFALCYFLTGGIEGMKSANFIMYFFFSVQTFSTVGYGAMYPATTLAHALVVTELGLGIMATAMLTGVFFAKLSQPRAKILFSNVAVVNRRDGKLCLMIRLANERNNEVAEAQAHVSVLKPETTSEGEKMRRLYDLTLARNITPNLMLSWTLIHEIDESSPLYGLDAEIMERDAIAIFVSITGFDTVFAQTVHARKVYIPTSIRFDARYADAIQVIGPGHTRLEYEKLHDFVDLNSAR